MARKCLSERNRKRERLVSKYAEKRRALKAIISDGNRPREERFQAGLKLASLPRNSSPTRLRNRCLVTGRSRGVYRKYRASRIVLREMISQGLVPGMVKSSW